MFRCITIFFILFLFGCNDIKVIDDDLDLVCPKGSETMIEAGRTFCVYEWKIVIETGFNCPADFGFFQGFEPVFGACTGFGPLNEGEIRRVFEDFQTLPKYNPTIATPTTGLDLLFVVDNSGSMCQEQDRLLAAFDSFIDPLKDVDFHLGITTTMIATDYSPEPIAQPGFLQSTPQPVPGFDQTCIKDIDETGTPIEGSFDGLRARIAVAVSCMDVPDETFLNFTDEDLKCATDGTMACSIGAICGGANNPKCQVSDVTPPPGSYRSLPKTFRAADYQKDDALDIEALSADFRCALTVGTRGYGIEKGLSAAVLAVSKENTGGAVGASDADTAKPNHGFIRKNTRFGLVFVSDENDCSDDGSLDENTSCGDAVCEYAIETGEGLISIPKLKADLIANLKASKGRDLSDKDILVGSIHGKPTALAGPIRTECPQGTSTNVSPACATASGVAYSGSRYADFLTAFGDSGYALSNASAICLEDWTEYFVSMGSFFRSRVN